MDDCEKNLNKAIEAERGRSGISKKVLSRRLGWGGGESNPNQRACQASLAGQQQKLIKFPRLLVSLMAGIL